MAGLLNVPAVLAVVSALALGLWHAFAHYSAAAEVHRAHIARLEQDRDRFQQINNELSEMEGGDAPLSDFLRAMRLYGEN